MKVVYLNDNSTFDSSNLVIALGFFDGFHKGHISVIDKAVEIARKKNAKSCVLTFSTSIISFINNEKFKYLTSLDDKVDLCLKRGVDEIAVITPTLDFINQSKEEFYDKYLKDSLALVVGFDYSFAKNKSGTPEYLKSLKETYMIDELKINSLKVGSNQIKEFLSLGDIESANLFLGREYSLKGKIYKRNKYYAMSLQDYFIPRDGFYHLKVVFKDTKKEFDAKIKTLDDKTGIIFKDMENMEVLSEFNLKNVEVFLTKSSSKNL